MLTGEDIKRLTCGTFGTCVSALGINVTNIADTESIVSIVCTIIGLIITIITCLIIPIVKWHRKSKADGKISSKELEEGMETLKDGLNTIKDELEQLKGDENEHKD